jgi:hypothetical protein
VITDKEKYYLTEAENAILNDLYAKITVLMARYNQQAKLGMSSKELEDTSRQLFTLFMKAMDTLEKVMRGPSITKGVD